MCPIKSKCTDLFVAGVICFNCTFGFMCEYKKNRFADTFSNEVPREKYFPQATKDSITVVASSSSPLTPPGNSLLTRIEPDPVIKGNQLHYFTFRLVSGDEKEEKGK